MDDRHALACGIAVGMSESELLARYPNVAIMDFDEQYISEFRGGNMGWNGVAFPDNWTEQFDYIAIANIDIGAVDVLPQYLGFFIKDRIIKAITIYFPTAG